MTPSGSWVDIVVVLLVIGYAVVGYRRGLFSAAVGTLGFVGGVFAALWLTTGGLLSGLSGGLFGGGAPGRPVLVLSAVLVAAVLGQALLLRIVRPLHVRIRDTPVRHLDGGLGAVVDGVVCAVMVWLGSGLMAAASPEPVSGAIRDSRVLAAVGEAMPVTSERLLGAVVATLSEHGFPRVFSDEPAIMEQVPAPDRALASSSAATRWRGSIVRIDALSMRCGRNQEGTGWVVAPHRVVTNAHVVAGAEEVSVAVPGHRAVTGRVVAFDSERDLAVLDVPEFDGPALPLGPRLNSGESVMLIGYPLGGPYHVSPGRIRTRVTALGEDIYGKAGVTRDVYAVRAGIKPGNSGGPMVTRDGTVTGVVFARSTRDAETAYVLTLDELRPVLDKAEKAASTVGTGRCVASPGR